MIKGIKIFQNFKSSMVIMSSLDENVLKELGKHRLCCNNCEFILVAVKNNIRKRKELTDSILEHGRVTLYLKCLSCNQFSRITYYFNSTISNTEILHLNIKKYNGGIEDIQEELLTIKPLLEVNYIEEDRLSNLYILDIKNLGTKEIFNYSYIHLYV